MKGRVLMIAEAFVMIMVLAFLTSGVVAFVWIVFEVVRN